MPLKLSFPQNAYGLIFFFSKFTHQIERKTFKNPLNSFSNASKFILLFVFSYPNFFLIRYLSNHQQKMTSMEKSILSEKKTTTKKNSKERINYFRHLFVCFSLFSFCNRHSNFPFPFSLFMIIWQISRNDNEYELNSFATKETD